jgi:hypothetical protein
MHPEMSIETNADISPDTTSPPTTRAVIASEGSPLFDGGSVTAGEFTPVMVDVGLAVV